MKPDPIIIARPLTREQVRDVDRRAVEEFGMSGLVLMENAGRGVAEWLIVGKTSGFATQFNAANSESSPTVGILCGKGNNAGDGYVIARHLQLAGWPVHIIQLIDANQLRGDALANWNIAQRAHIETLHFEPNGEEDLSAALRTSDIILDCMLGTGASGDPRGPLATAIRIANEQPALRVAVDTPSGLDCQTGHVGNPHFVAHHTCTMVASKAGFDAPEARQVLGCVHIIGIGVPRALLESFAANS